MNASLYDSDFFILLLVYVVLRVKNFMQLFSGIQNFEGVVMMMLVKMESTEFRAVTAVLRIWISSDPKIFAG